MSKNLSWIEFVGSLLIGVRWPLLNRFCGNANISVINFNFPITLTVFYHSDVVLEAIKLPIFRVAQTLYR
jgi:hypothetical protein